MGSCPDAFAHDAVVRLWHARRVSHFRLVWDTAGRVDRWWAGTEGERTRAGRGARGRGVRLVVVGIVGGGVWGWHGPWGYRRPNHRVPDPTPGSQPTGIAAGPDGNLWFTQDGAIGRITPNGMVTEYPVNSPTDVAAGPDGNLWFTNIHGMIGRITPAGTITSYSIPTANSDPGGIARGDGRQSLVHRV